MLSSMKTKADHREFKRAPLSGVVKFFAWDQTRQAEGVEVSGGGVFLRTREPLSEGSMITVRLAVPGLNRAFTVLGKVVRTVKGGLFAAPGMGVRFLDLKPADRESILQYVEGRCLRVEAA